MTSGAAGPDRYSRTSFIAAIATIAGVETLTWAFYPILLVCLALFAITSLLVLGTGAVLRRAGGPTGQIGRGMLIGWLATPLTIAITVIPATVYMWLIDRG